MREEKKLMVENAKLKRDIEELKKQLLDKERSRGGTSLRALTPSDSQKAASAMLFSTILCRLRRE